jgi:hypothetical protein
LVTTMRQASRTATSPSKAKPTVVVEFLFGTLRCVMA